MRLKLLFSAYLALLAWVVLWKLELPHVGAVGPREAKLIPFFGTSNFDANGVTEIAINVLLFLPLGVFLGALARRARAFTLVLAFAGTSLVFEALQFALNIGMFDVTDLVVNTAGASLGLFAVRLAYRASTSRDRVTRALTRWCFAGVAIAWIGAAVFVVSPLHYVQGGNGGLGSHVSGQQ